MKESPRTAPAMGTKFFFQVFGGVRQLKTTPKNVDFPYGNYNENFKVVKGGGTGGSRRSQKQVCDSGAARGRDACGI